MAVSEQTIEVRRSRVPRLLLRLVLFVLAGAAGLGLAAGALAAFHEQEAGRILPGITIAGVDVGGRTPDEARQIVADRFASLHTGGIVLRSGLGSMTIAFADVGRGADVDAMVADAAGQGRGGTWLDESIAAIRLRLHGIDVPLRLTYDHDLAAAAVARFAERTALHSIDASVTRSGKSFGIVRGTDARSIDAIATLAAVDAAMRDLATPAGTGVAVGQRRVPPTLTTEMAEAARVAANRLAMDVKIRTPTKTWTLDATRVQGWITFGWSDGVYAPRIDSARIPAALKKIAKSVKRPVLDAEYLRDKHGRIVGSKADRAGQELDRGATAKAIAAAITASAGATHTKPVHVVMAIVAPARTTADVTKNAPLMSMVGSWTTYYQVAAHNGFGANITVPARVLNGTVVQPGAVFDFWGGLGEVSLRTGYRLGGAIVGGHSVEGKALAGGICAASTTLFNAALRGGFEILARQPHWYYITRYPLGLDATVSGSQTMRFRNDTPHAILIRGFASPGVVRFEIWSVPNGRTVTLSRPLVSNVVPGADSTVNAPDLPKGTSERIEWPVDGKDVVVTRVVRDASGRVIHRDTFVSHYHRMIGINRIGIG